MFCSCAKDSRFKLWYTLDRPGDSWKYSKGFITEDMIREHLPPKSDDTLARVQALPLSRPSDKTNV